MSLPTTPSLATAGGRVTVDLGALTGNWRMLAEQAEGAATAAVVKGDGYGVGLEAVARRWPKRAARFFVALPEEGFRLRSAARRDHLRPRRADAGGAEAMASARPPVLGSWPEIGGMGRIPDGGGRPARRSTSIPA
jgi:alanine racemase